ncbi:hypothetical protein B5G06_13620, partial [Flavonifractor sp. An52]
GDNPLTIWHYPRLGLYIYASTLAILHQAVNRTWLAGEPFGEVPLSDGEILRWDKHGLTTAGHFTMTYPIYRPWHPCARSYQPDRSYLRTLKNIASALGYTPEDIDELLEAGYSTDEIEEELYGIPGWQEYR